MNAWRQVGKMLDLPAQSLRAVQARGFAFEMFIAIVFIVLVMLIAINQYMKLGIVGLRFVIHVASLWTLMGLAVWYCWVASGVLARVASPAHWQLVPRLRRYLVTALFVFWCVVPGMIVLVLFFPVASGWASLVLLVIVVNLLCATDARQRRRLAAYLLVLLAIGIVQDFAISRRLFSSAQWLRDDIGKWVTATAFFGGWLGLMSLFRFMPALAAGIFAAWFAATLGLPPLLGLRFGETWTLLYQAFSQTLVTVALSGVIFLLNVWCLAIRSADSRYALWQRTRRLTWLAGPSQRPHAAPVAFWRTSRTRMQRAATARDIRTLIAYSLGPAADWRNVLRWAVLLSGLACAVSVTCWYLAQAPASTLRNAPALLRDSFGIMSYMLLIGPLSVWFAAVYHARREHRLLMLAPLWPDRLTLNRQVVRHAGTWMAAWCAAYLAIYGAAVFVCSALLLPASEQSAAVVALFALTATLGGLAVMLKRYDNLPPPTQAGRSLLVPLLFILLLTTMTFSRHAQVRLDHPFSVALFLMLGIFLAFAVYRAHRMLRGPATLPAARA